MLKNYYFLRLTKKHFCSLPFENIKNKHKEYTLEEHQIENVIKQVPSLKPYPSHLWHNMHNIFTNQGFETDNFLEIVTKNPQILPRHTSKIVQNLEYWRICQFGEKPLKELITNYPILLDIDNERQIREKFAFLKSLGLSTKNIWRLFMNSPNIIKDNEEIIKEKFEYLTDVVRIDHPEIAKSEVFSFTLNEIKCRYIFLVRLGIYKVKSYKADPKEPTKNPKLKDIMCSSEKRFATKIAGVTFLEYETFKDYFDRELEKENEDEEIPLRDSYKKKL